MALGIHVREVADHSFIVNLNGSIDNESYVEFERQLKTIVHDGIKALYLDMKRVDYISSAGMGVLVTERKTLNKYNGLMVMVGIQPLVKKVFDMMKLSPLFLMIEDLPCTEAEMNSLLARHVGIQPLSV